MLAGILGDGLLVIQRGGVWEGADVQDARPEPLVLLGHGRLTVLGVRKANFAEALGLVEGLSTPADALRRRAREWVLWRRLVANTEHVAELCTMVAGSSVILKYINRIQRAARAGNLVPHSHALRADVLAVLFAIAASTRSLRPDIRHAVLSVVGELEVLGEVVRIWSIPVLREHVLRALEAVEVGGLAHELAAGTSELQHFGRTSGVGETKV